MRPMRVAQGRPPSHQSDAKRIELGLSCEIVGMSQIKERRLKKIEVPCHAGTRVGDYVPFYFCPRSIMLYILHKGNHPDLNYKEGQAPIVHLQADFHRTIRWADERDIRWAFSDCNAGSEFAQFFKSVDDLEEVNWGAVQATDFRDIAVKEGKQAEFLLWESFPWTLIENTGVIDARRCAAVGEVLASATHRPPVKIQQGWYY
jgi:hypothetical protein